MPTNRSTVTRGYPLGALFLLTAVCAVLLGMVSLLLQHAQRLDDLLWPLVISIFVGAGTLMLVGLILGLFHHDRLRGAFWGMGIGWFLGMFFGPVLFIPPAAFPLVLIMSTGGALLVLGWATLIRLSASQSPSPSTPRVDESPVVPAKRHPLDPDEDDQPPPGV